MLNKNYIIIIQNFKSLSSNDTMSAKINCIYIYKWKLFFTLKIKTAMFK